MEVNRFVEAEQHLLKAVRLNPNSADVVKNLGNLYYLQGEYTKAVPRYLGALQLNPGMISAMYPLADIYYKQKKYVLAERTYQDILRQAGPSSAAHHGLGAVYSSLGRGQEATAQFREALRLDPDNLNARQSLDALTGRSRDDVLRGFNLGF